MGSAEAVCTNPRVAWKVVVGEGTADEPALSPAAAANEERKKIAHQILRQNVAE
jgi:hypothetical protein